MEERREIGCIGHADFHFQLDPKISVSSLHSVAEPVWYQGGQITYVIFCIIFFCLHFQKNIMNLAYWSLQNMMNLAYWALQTTFFINLIPLKIFAASTTDYTLLHPDKERESMQQSNITYTNQIPRFRRYLLFDMFLLKNQSFDSIWSVTIWIFDVTGYPF